MYKFCAHRFTHNKCMHKHTTCQQIDDSVLTTVATREAIKLMATIIVQLTREGKKIEQISYCKEQKRERAV